MKVQNVKFKVVGVTFANDDGTSRQGLISAMTNNSPVILEREPHNVHDTNAVMVKSIDGQLGYIPKEYAKIIAPMMDGGKKFKAKVDELGYYKSAHYIHITVDEE